MSEARAEDRLDRLERDVVDIKATLARLEPLIVRIDERLNTELPHLATKAELAALDGKLSTALADKPNRAELWGAIAAMVGAQALIAAVLAAILAWSPPAHGAEPPLAPYSCRLYDEQRKCAFGACDKRVVERLRNECLRDGGRP